MSRKNRNKNDSSPIEDVEIREYLDAQKVKTRRTYERYFRVILRIGKESGKEMLEHREMWSRKILTVQQKLREFEYSDSSILCMTGIIRGFFGFYKKPLDLSVQDKRKLNQTSRNSEDYSFSQGDIKKMLENVSGDPKQKLKESYVLICGLSYGLRSEDFVHALTFGKYRNALKQSVETPVSLGTITTEKETGVLAHPFISSDALPTVQAILATNPDAKDEDRVFDEDPIRLTTILQNLAKKAGIDPHGQRIRFCNCRRYLFSRLNAVSSSEQAKLIIGKKIQASDSVYLNTEHLREVYQKAESNICVLNGNGQAVKKEVSNLKEENEKLKQRIADLEREKLQNMEKMSTVEKTLNDLMELPSIAKELQKKKEKVEFS